MVSLPPLNSLRAFEAAARHLSMSRAADELHVTPAAVSHQVKGLEEFLGVKLFIRQQRGLELTPAGELYAPGLRVGFQKLQEATEGLFESERAGPLSVSTSPSFAAKWLVHRLERFTRDHPDIQVLLSAITIETGYNRSDSDVAVRYGAGTYPGCRTDKLFDEEVFPVCAPGLLSGKNPIKVPADLLAHTLLHPVAAEYDESFPTWDMWLRSYGVEVEGPVPGPHISPHWMLVEAAAAGQGVALVKASVAEDDLLKGRIVRPFADRVHVNHAYWLVCDQEIADKPKVKAFREWMMEEARLHAEHHAKLEADLVAEKAQVTGVSIDTPATVPGVAG